MATARKLFARKSFIVSETGEFNGARFTFTDGRVLTCGLHEVQKHILMQLASHGIRQKVGDSYNQADTVAEAYNTAVEVWNRLVDGAWSAEREGGFGINLDDLAYAVSQIKGVDMAKARKAIDDATEDKRKELAAHAKVKALMAEAKAARLQAAADASEDIEFDL